MRRELGEDDLGSAKLFSQAMSLTHPTEALAKRWEGRQIVMLVDEIMNKEMLSNLGEESIHQSVRMILVRSTLPTRLMRFSVASLRR